MRLSELMSAPVRTVSGTTSAAAAWEQMQLHRVRHLVVTDADGRVNGIIGATDLGGRAGEALRKDRPVADFMTEKVIIATPQTTVREAANLMRGHSVNCLPVFEGGKLKGIVTSLDLLELLGRGIERPMATATRAVLKDRGRKPRALAVAERVSGAKRRA